ncbi:glycosyltransferase family 2 protein [uncultured Oscillibacter sp.]|jgi:glycosyltransferase involved in cell wall biosynthesis|uniref:glycosyltransferase family 2 protein n=1 Tax=uncultured Oscillibacter sp. TaxID=876091 RepID=UPI0025FE613F|nr:glycosyltransferase family 2 protein [uncultured Oscillibacter sp.]
MPKVTIYTQAYNPGEYLTQCVESVLNQTYTDFEWILIDHGSTDNTREVIRSYAERDKRIIPVYIDVNGSVPNLLYGTVRREGTGKYFAYLDSDDWWDLDYLERLVPFAEENDLDLALTGAVNYYQAPGSGYGVSRVLRKLDAPMILTLEEFARNYPVAGPYAGALWASLRPLDKFLETESDPKNMEIWIRGLNWRSDTLMMLNYADHCRRIGINEFAPYHYRQYGTSLSRRYSENYFESNLYFHQRLEEFFRCHGVLDVMEDYLRERHLFEMLSTLDVLRHTPLPGDQKMRDCAKIVAHPLTMEALTYDCPDREKWCAYVWNIASEVLRDGRLTDVEAARTVLGLLAQDCAGAVTAPAQLELFAEDETLRGLLLRNDKEGLARRLLERTRTEERPERSGGLLRGLLPEDSPLRQVEDPRFFQDHNDIARLVFNGGCLVALDQMTGLLTAGGPVKSEEALLRLYLTLAALENQVPAFLFGKLRLAELYRRENRREECRALVAELEEMGAGGLPEAAALREAWGEETE